MAAAGTKTINVVVSGVIPVAAQALQELCAVDPCLNVRAVSPEQRPFLRAGAGDAPDQPARELAAFFADAEVVVGVFDAPPDLLKRAPNLRWFHTIAAGIDQFVRWGYLRGGIMFTNGSGPSAIPIAEYCLTAILALAKNLPHYTRTQQQHTWDRSGGGRELRGKTVGIIGLGQIGSETARLAKAVGCRVIGSRRSVEQPRENAEGVDLLLGPADLPRLLAESDFVVLAAPSTPETATLINAGTLAQMKPGACLINIARGTLVDHAALAEALQAGTIAGAALDVTDPEPLNPESPLWDMPNVLITPHVSSASEHFFRRQLDLVKENLGHYVRGEPLLNLVPPERGY